MKRDKSFSWQRVDAVSINLAGKKVLVIGGTGGLGRAISRSLASRGASVVVVGQTFRDSDMPGIEFIKADLSLLREADRVAAQLPAETADIVVFTAGIFAAPKRQETAEGIERDIAVSYLNRLVMLRNIAPRLGKGRTSAASKPRIFNMAYPGSGQLGNPDDLNSEKSYGAMPAHMNTVAGNEILVLDGAKRYPHLDIFGLNPGVIRTNIRSNFLGGNKVLFSLIEWMIGLLNPGAEAYADRIAPLLVSPDLEGHSGALFNQKGQAILPSPGMTDSHMKAFLVLGDTGGKSRNFRGNLTRPCIRSLIASALIRESRHKDGCPHIN